MPFQPNHLSVLGIIHTAISILALLVAYYALFRKGKIDPATAEGKLYILLTIITCISGLPIMKTGHPTAGHFLAIIILVLLPAGMYIRSFKFLGKAAGYLQTIIMSTTLFLSMIPAVVETFTRLPISHPIANGPNAPVVQMGLLTLLILYLVGVIYQLLKIRSKNKTAPTAGGSIKLS